METNIIFNVSSTQLITALAAVFVALLGIVWKGKKEIRETIENELGSLKSGIPAMTNAVIELQTIFRTNGITISQNLVERGSSPLQPTEFGASLITESGLEKVLDEHKESLCVKLRASLPDDYTEYDVQEKARQLLVSLKNDSMMNPVKEWVYNHPTDIEIILKTGGLWLRDDFLKLPRGINKDSKKESK